MVKMLKPTRLSLPAVIAVFAACALQIHAANFTFEPGSSLTIYDSLVSNAPYIAYGISGTFTYGGGQDSNVNVTLTGAGPFAGLYTATDPTARYSDCSAQNCLILLFTSPWDIDITFQSSLNSSPPDLLSYVYLENQTFGYNSGDIVSTESGGVVFATTTTSTPEPSAIWLTAAGCAILGLCLRRRKAQKDSFR
jgi:hypothetical protein